MASDIFNVPIYHILLEPKYCGHGYDGDCQADDCKIVYTAKVLERIIKSYENKNHKLGVHLSHCNFGENINSCKYGEFSSCPALTESWSWFGLAMQKYERTINQWRLD